MKTCKPLLLIAVALLLALNTFAQQSTSVKEIIDSGIKLHDEGKFDQAIEKYKQALKLEPQNTLAMYEMAYSYDAQKKPDEALMYLNKVIAIEKMPGAYDMLGNIYDDKGDREKAISYYKKGIEADSTYHMLHFNLGIAYVRQDNYALAEASLVSSLKLEPSHASSHRLYALVSKQLGNDAATVMACSNFLLLEPKSQRSQSVYNTLKTTIDSKFKRTGDKSINITLKNTKDQDPSIGALELGLSMAAVNSTLEKNQGKTQTELFQEQLDTFFRIAGELSEKKKDKAFLWRFYADYFYSLAKSGNMPAFTRYISLSAGNPDDQKWLQTNGAEFKKFSAWANETKHVTQ